MKLLAFGALLVPAATALWPIPSKYSSGQTVLWIGEHLQVQYNGANSTSSHPRYDSDNSGPPSSAEIVQAAVQRTYATIFDQNFVPWKFHPRNADFEPSSRDSRKKYIKTINLLQTGTDPANLVKAHDGDVDESYSLSVTTSGEVTIKATTSIGIVRGLTTFTQLFYEHSDGGAYTNQAPVEIEDKPKFVHRGINMDVSRNYFPVKDIKRMIDAAGYAKMNRFHIHATDSQAWPLVIPAMPELSAKGAYRPELVYTPEQIEDIQHYGALHGIQVYLEIDMPGHTSSIWYSHPDLVAAFHAKPWSTYAAEPPAGTLKLNSPAVYKFLDTLLGDLLPRLSPYTTYFHTGGDEVNKNAYKLDDTVKSSDPAVLQPLMQKFIDRNHDQVRKLGLTPIVWEEMLLEWNLTLKNDVVVQSWMSDESVASIVSKGYKALVGNYNYWYLDCGQGQWLDFTQGDVAKNAWPYNDYCYPRHNWRVIYSYDPLSGVAEKDESLVLGGEVHIWAEQTDPVNIDRMLWPRAAAAAEVLWSGAKDASGQNRSQIEASPRLSEFRERLVARGVAAEPIQMPFCLQNGTQCFL